MLVTNITACLNMTIINFIIFIIRIVVVFLFVIMYQTGFREFVCFGGGREGNVVKVFREVVWLLWCYNMLFSF